MYMMTPSNGDIVRVTGPVCGEFTGHPWIPCTKANEAELWCFFFIWTWINDCINNRAACDLRRRRFILMYVTWYNLQVCMVGSIDCSGVFLFCYFSSPWHDSMRLYCHFVNTKPWWYITTLTLCISKTLPNLWHLSNLRHVIHSSRNSISYLETASQTDMPRELNMTKKQNTSSISYSIRDIFYSTINMILTCFSSLVKCCIINMNFVHSVIIINGVHG